MVVGSIYFYMFHYDGTERFADLHIYFAAAACSKQSVGEVCVHAAAVPVKIAQRFAMPVDGDAIFLADSFKKVAGQPHLVAGFLSPLGKNLKLPLTRRYFGIDPFNIEAGVQASIQMFFHQWAAIGVTGAH